MLFALLATFAPAFDTPVTGNDFEEHVSAPADPRSDAAFLVCATQGVAEDLEEEEDQEEATFLALTTLHYVPDAGYKATDAWLPSSPRLSAHLGTGPPIL